MRLDIYLTEKNLAKSRSKAAEYITGGFVLVNGKTVTKASAAVSEEDDVVLAGKPYDYVSRGGLKLEGALVRFGVDVTGKTACDIGASTGGFTDCLLKKGAVRVYAVDSGKDQLDDELRKDSRVVSIEGFNARDLTYDTIGERCSVIVSDLSFISQTYIIPVLPGIAQEDAVFVSLIKPQFECGREALNKNGIVKDKKFHMAAIRKVLSCAAEYGFSPTALMKSVIKGGDGNVEYLFLAERCPFPSDKKTVDDNMIREVVNETH